MVQSRAVSASLKVQQSVGCSEDSFHTIIGPPRGTCDIGSV